MKKELILNKPLAIALIGMTLLTLRAQVFCTSGETDVTCMTAGTIISSTPGPGGAGCPATEEIINFDVTGTQCTAAVRPPDFIGPLRGSLGENVKNGQPNLGTAQDIDNDFDEEFGCVTTKDETVTVTEDCDYCNGAVNYPNNFCSY